MLHSSCIRSCPAELALAASATSNSWYTASKNISALGSLKILTEATHQMS